MNLKIPQFGEKVIFTDLKNSVDPNKDKIKITRDIIIKLLKFFKNLY